MMIFKKHVCGLLLQLVSACVRSSPYCKPSPGRVNSKDLRWVQAVKILGGSIVMAVPNRWMVYFMENPNL